MFVVHSGTISVRLADDSPKGWHEVAQLGPGTVFGEMALLTGETRTADVVALTDVTALEIGKDSLQPILHGPPRTGRCDNSESRSPPGAPRRDPQRRAGGRRDDDRLAGQSVVQAVIGLSSG